LLFLNSQILIKGSYVPVKPQALQLKLYGNDLKNLEKKNWGKICSSGILVNLTNADPDPGEPNKRGSGSAALDLKGVNPDSFKLFREQRVYLFNVKSEFCFYTF